MTTPTWQITNMERNAGDGGVIVAQWTCMANDGTYSGSLNGSTAFTYDASAPGFTPYDQLTEAQVLQWVLDSIGTDGVQSVTDDVLGQIANQQQQVEAGVPWAA